MPISRITSKGQVTIPKKIREFLNIGAYDTIEFTLLENGKVLISSEKHSAKALFGMLKHKKQCKPVSIEEMNAAIQERYRERSSR
ncbi:MAG: type II toxin-antitoxin system PrlF family antitoxin [Desulfosalsimonadaceae bacterium]